ncbi:hypothetical protein M2266_002358 [Streptomyces sp. SPB162]|nr:hypothetical protein [Streptomyces sp. SPB162]
MRSGVQEGSSHRVIHATFDDATAQMSVMACLHLSKGWH